MAWASITYIFSPSTTAKSAEVNQNFNDLISAIDTAMPSDSNGHGIILWSGAIADIPSSWYLCDGNNGTPNLKDRFVVGAGGGYSVGATGGADSVTLTEAQMPSHNHGGGNHGHSASSSTTGNHSHSLLGHSGGGSGGVRVDAAQVSYQGTTSATGNHSHTITVNNSGTVIGTQGSSQSHENRPPFYALAYIMKS